jgi:hypothetical protein
MTPPTAIQDLQHSEATFTAVMQQLGFGRFEYLQIRRGESVLNPGPPVVRDVKFGSPATTGKPVEAASELGPQVTEIFTYVRETDAGEVRELEVRDGMPFSMQVEMAATRLRGGRA